MEVVGVVTHDRLTSLVACLESYVANCRRHARTPEFVVSHDTADDTPGQVVRTALRSLKARGVERIRYLGLVEKRRFANVLARESSVSGETIDFALFGDPRCRLSTGANRNGLLLDTLDTLVFCADDDTVCRTGAAPEAEGSAVFFAGYDPTEFWFFADHQDALEAVPGTEISVLGGHEQFLGKTLAEVGAPAGLSGRVTITLNGLLGDSGMGSPQYLLTVNGPSRARLLASRAAYLSALRSRVVLRTVPRPTIAAGAFCMTTFFGLDNRWPLLPPFFPVERNSDGIFGHMVRRSVEGSYTVFLPWVLLHAPPEPRAFAGEEPWTEPGHVRMADVLMAAILAHDTPGAGDTCEARLRRLGSFLRDLGGAKLEDFEAFLSEALRLQSLASAILFEKRLNEHGCAPTFWADDVRRTIEKLRQTTAKQGFTVPRDLDTAGDVDGARRLTRELVSKFGELLEAWPVLVETARRLRTKGSRLSAPV